MQTLLQQACIYNLRSNIYKFTKGIWAVSAKQKMQKKMSKVTAINIIIDKKNQLNRYQELNLPTVGIEDVRMWLDNIQRELEKNDTISKMER